MRNLYLILLFIICSASVNAQQTSSDYANQKARMASRIPLDKSILECIYSYKVYDPELDQTREKLNILEIGKFYSKYADYSRYRCDSLVDADYPNGPTNGEYTSLLRRLNPTLESTIRDLKAGTISTYDKVFIDRYVYTESIPEISWKLSKETAQICGYKCHKATATFRGRNWIAWYCEIPQYNGPWKFGNLPGLILKVEDDKKEHIFEAISIRKGARDIYLIKLDYEKTNRKKYNESLAEYKHDPSSFIGMMPDSPLLIDGKIKIHKQFFNPIEKD